MPKVVLKLGDDVSTDVIYPGRYMATVLPAETPQYAFADHPEFGARCKSGTLARGSVSFPKEIARVELLGDGALTFTRDATALMIDLPAQKVGDYAHAFKITARG